MSEDIVARAVSGIGGAYMIGGKAGQVCLAQVSIRRGPGICVVGGYGGCSGYGGGGCVGIREASGDSLFIILRMSMFSTDINYINYNISPWRYKCPNQKVN